MNCTHTRIAPFGNAKMCIDCLEVFADEEEGTEDPTELWGSIDTDAVVKISGGLFQNLCAIAAAAEGAMEVAHPQSASPRSDPSGPPNDGMSSETRRRSAQLGTAGPLF